MLDSRAGSTSDVTRSAAQRGEDHGAHWFEDELARVPLCVETELGTLEIAFVELRVTYDHVIRPLGRRAGELSCVVALRPGQRVRVHHREARSRASHRPRVSVKTAFMQLLAQLHVIQPEPGKSPSHVLGRPDGASLAESTRPLRSSSTAAQAFVQSVHRASECIHAERAREAWVDEHAAGDDDEGTVHNQHDVPVTCIVRRVVEQFAVTTRVCEVSYRISGSSPRAPWRELDDVRGMPEDVRDQLLALRRRMPRVGEAIASPQPFSLPTDEIAIEVEAIRAGVVEPTRVAANDAHRSKRRAQEC